ncbi:MAG TPA: TspO/MBR family protein [Chryseosolibacter sp.]
MNLRLLNIGNTLLFIAVLVVNFLANALPINGMNTGEVSRLYPSLFTPSGITFSIWSVIYLSLFAFVVYQWKINDRSYFASLSKWFILSCVLNITWILVWHNLLPAVSVIVMLLFLVVLIKLFRLVQQAPLESRKEYFLIRLPFTLYLSWICVATIANIAAWLAGLNIIQSVSTQTILTIVMMLVASALAIIIVLRFRDYAFPAVTIWALTGIALKGLEMITHAAIAIALALAGVLLFSVVRSKRTTSN